ncbi:uncharacterized protein BT62DRAFT_625437 [Guyanagaster necrorhizus]|uniref:Uncharacterized protein n=1 Tax=Guyanagaster necrorhizus TaxID=856835 RepID=A0A9P7VH02_9AGAR|nr:uncharacterized protein BT62DRAFT_625437 [Guyanagaster necrorhizus MCA 3950]KAG7440397.1 hypothetical protein BT62DRAFT_625437 [Guyanagaster necrorhizus MCA 3950]
MYFLGVSADNKPDPVLGYDLRMQTRHGFRRRAPVPSMSILSMQSLALRTPRRTNLTLTLYSLAHRTNLFTALSLNRMCMLPWKDTTLPSLHMDRPPQGRRTPSGNESEPGIIPRAMKDVSDSSSETRRGNISFVAPTSRSATSPSMISSLLLTVRL